jgi:hypothetical protein
MLCNENAPLSKVIGTVVGSEPPLLTALIEISFSSVGKAVSYNARVPGSNSIGNELIKLVYPRHLSLKCLYQAMNMSGYVLVLRLMNWPLSTIFLLVVGNVSMLLIPTCKYNACMPSHITG